MCSINPFRAEQGRSVLLATEGEKPNQNPVHLYRCQSGRRRSFATARRRLDASKTFLPCGCRTANDTSLYVSAYYVDYFLIYLREAFHVSMPFGAPVDAASAREQDALGGVGGGDRSALGRYQLTASSTRTSWFATLPKIRRFGDDSDVHDEGGPTSGIRPFTS